MLQDQGQDSKLAKILEQLFRSSYQQNRLLVQPMLVLTCLSANVKLKFQHSTPRWFWRLKTGRKTLQHSLRRYGTLVPGWKESLYISLSSKDVAFFKVKMTWCHIRFKSQHSSLGEIPTASARPWADRWSEIDQFFKCTSMWNWTN